MAAKARRTPSSRIRGANDPAGHAINDRNFETVRQALKLGKFGPGVQSSLTALLSSIRTRTDSRHDELRELKRTCVTAEALDYYGRWAEARDATSEGKTVLEQLQRDSASSALRRDKAYCDLTREKVRLCIAYGQAFFYRRQDYESAKEVVTTCLNLVKSLQEQAGHRTLGQINLHLGRIYRQTGEYNLADAAFSDAIESFNHRLQVEVRKTGGHISEPERQSALYKTALCLAGLGWVCYTRGELRRALSYVIPAHTIFLNSQDALNLAYLELLRASIHRSLAGNDRAALTPALSMVQRAHLAFEGGSQYAIDHPSRRARTAYELAQIHSLMGNRAPARKYLADAIALSKGNNDERWLCTTTILASRIETRDGDPQAGERLADEALELANRRRFVAPKAGALISRGEARFSQRRFADAQGDLEKALKLNQASRDGQRDAENPQIEAVCLLNLARCHAAKDEPDRARVFFTKWLEIASRVEHKHVHDLAGDVHLEVFGRGRDFVILDKEPDLDFLKRKRQLMVFLYEQASVAARGRKGDIADRLGISRQTLHNWERELLSIREPGSTHEADR